jgi:signal transduction histidine kinase
MQDAIRDAERLRRLQVLTDAALAHLQLDDLLASLLARTRDVLGVDTCAALLLDEERGELVAQAAVGLEEEVERGLRIPVGQGFAGTVAARGEAIVLDDVDHTDVLNPLLREKGIKSLLGVPLIVGGTTIGVLHVGTMRPRVFGTDDVELLQLAADRAAIAIEHSRMFERERAARRRIEHVQAITAEALAHLEVDDLLGVVLPLIRDMLGADTCAVLLLEEDGGELVARAAVGLEEEVEQRVRIPVGRGFAGRVAATQRPVVIGDLDQAEVLNPILREKGIKSMLGVPLVVRGESLGVLHVATLTPRRFSQDDVGLLQLVAERVAIAIERARLHEETVQLDQLKLNFVAVASHELRTPATAVYGALATIFGRTDLTDEVRDELLRTAYEQSQRLAILLEQLLDLSRLDARVIRTDARPVVLRSVLRAIIDAALPEGTRVRLDVPADLASLVDPLVLDRIVSNLLINAVRHGSPPVVVAAEQRDRHLRVTVEDGGAGVPESLRPHLFERFARGTGAGGSGLGLAIAKAYARAHGGDLVYQPGESGARFELTVPQL